MSEPKLPAIAPTTSTHRSGVYLAILQLALTLGWTVCVICLPKLVDGGGGLRRPR